MRFQFASDLHLEILANRQFVAAGVIKPVCDYLLLAGDIANLNRLEDADWFWDWCSNNFLQTWIVPGNHEFYGEAGELIDAETLMLPIRGNVAYCNNARIDVEDATILFSTLWSSIETPEQRAAVEKQVSDYRQILQGGRMLTVDAVNAMHVEARNFLQTALATCDPTKTVVATHYVPVPQATPARYIDSPVREAFVADCSEMVREFRPAYWVHGHSHVSGCVVCGGTRIVSNQLGTVRPQKELNFNPTAVIEL